MRSLRTCVLMIPVLALLILASWADSATAADSMSDKWFSPAPSAAKKNPINPTHESLAAGQKIFSKTCAMCHGKGGDADGPAVIELNIHPAKLSDPQLATDLTVRYSGRLRPAKSRCPHTANDFPKRIAGIWSITFGRCQSDNPLPA